MDIDIRQHMVKIKYDSGQEEISTETIELGHNNKGELIRIKVSRDNAMNVVSVKVQNL